MDERLKLHTTNALLEENVDKTELCRHRNLRPALDVPYTQMIIQTSAQCLNPKCGAVIAVTLIVPVERVITNVH